jgi:hypothetical protein
MSDVGWKIRVPLLQVTHLGFAQHFASFVVAVLFRDAFTMISRRKVSTDWTFLVAMVASLDTV